MGDVYDRPRRNRRRALDVRGQRMDVAEDRAARNRADSKHLPIEPNAARGLADRVDGDQHPHRSVEREEPVGALAPRVTPALFLQ
jgi:hypothetical protein